MEFLTEPIAWWVDPFVDNTFMRNALWAALLAVLTTSVVGTWVVLRGMTFLGDAFAHGVLPGIALAYIIGFSTTIGALGAALLIVGGIHLIRSFSPLSEETSIGVLFVGFLALAVVIMSSGAGAYSGDLTRFLFGAITGIDNDDLRRQAIAAAISVGTTVLLHRALFVATFDEAQAQLAGMRPKLAHAALLTLLAIAIVSSFEAVGSLLVFAFLVAPAATASLLVRRVPRIMMTAVGLGAVAALVGLLVSYHHDTAAGATMALATVVMLLMTLLVTGVIRALRRPSDQATEAAQDEPAHDHAA
ncbi:metal ABC transporter permease [Candidatus Poriferisodalis sp.]|uniref:metal ABC transporter permease n=1 Tax=Candidatus Poriferisodalis sp. TaxID=3101277 RepID=UPI003B58DF36